MTPEDLHETMVPFTLVASIARRSQTVTTTTYALPQMVVFPHGDRAWATRELRVTVTEGARAVEVSVTAHAAPLSVDWNENDGSPLEIAGDTEWIDLPAELAPLFQPVIDPT